MTESANLSLVQSFLDFVFFDSFDLNGTKTISYYDKNYEEYNRQRLALYAAEDARYNFQMSLLKIFMVLAFISIFIIK